MSKTKEELDALKEKVNSVNEKLKELTPEELEQVNGGVPCGKLAVGGALCLSVLQGKAAGVDISSGAGLQGAGACSLVK